MKVDLKVVAANLYEAFGDQGIAWVQEQATAYFRESPKEGPETPRTGGEQETTTNEEEETAFPTHEDGFYEDGDAFASNLDDAVQNLTNGSIQSPSQIPEVILELVLMAGEVRKFEEAQITKRVHIAAERDIALARIKAQQELLQDYLDRSFDERAGNFKKLFTVVDDALATGNMNALALGLESVVKLATSSPFKDLRSIEETAAALGNPNHEWDF